MRQFRMSFRALLARKKSKPRIALCARAHWEIIADNLSKAGCSWGCISALDCEGRTTCVVDAHRGDGERFIVHADEKLSGFVELESAIRGR